MWLSFGFTVAPGEVYTSSDGRMIPRTLVPVAPGRYVLNLVIRPASYVWPYIAYAAHTLTAYYYFNPTN
jgi:hypothetical protein